MTELTTVRPTCLAGGGAAGERLRAIDWSTNPLGPVEVLSMRSVWPEARLRGWLEEQADHHGFRARLDALAIERGPMVRVVASTPGVAGTRDASLTAEKETSAHAG